MSSYDIAVIGGGPGGYVAAIKVAQAGKSVLLAEKNEIGGVCLNRGCIPTKSIIKSISVLNSVRQCAQFGIRGVDASGVTLDVAAMHARANQVVCRLAAGVKALLKGNGVTVKRGVASFRDRFTLAIDNDLFESANVIIATGSKPASLPVPVSQDAPVITSDEALQLSEMPEIWLSLAAASSALSLPISLRNLELSARSSKCSRAFCRWWTTKSPLL